MSHKDRKKCVVMAEGSLPEVESLETPALKGQLASSCVKVQFLGGLNKCLSQFILG